MRTFDLTLCQKKMSNGLNSFIQNVLYLILFVNGFILFIIFSVINSVVLGLKSLLFCLNMTESSKKRKKTSNVEPNQTISTRGLIDANWQKFLSSSLIMDKKTEKPAQESNKEFYTGAFRRARKKKSKDHDSVQNNLKTLNLASNSNSKPSVNSIELKNKFSVLKDDEEVNAVVSNTNLEKPNENKSKNRLTKFLAMDCEMVGIGYDGNDHMLARVSIVNKFGDCIYDKFVKAREEVKDYRTEISGVRKEDLINGEDFTKVQKEVAELMKGRILVGHSLKNDLSVLFLSHPKRNIRDTSRYKPFRKITKGSTPSLKRLAKELLGIDIQSGEHSSIEDARAAMQLYCSVARQWEPQIADKRGKRKVLPDD